MIEVQQPEVRTLAHDQRLLLARLGASDDATALIHVAEAIELLIYLRARNYAIAPRMQRPGSSYVTNKHNMQPC